MHTFNPSTWEAEAGDLYEFEARLVYRVSSRTGSKATQRNLILNLPTPKKSSLVSKTHVIVAE